MLVHKVLPKKFIFSFCKYLVHPLLHIDPCPSGFHVFWPAISIKKEAICQKIAPLSFLPMRKIIYLIILTELMRSFHQSCARLQDPSGLLEVLVNSLLFPLKLMFS